MNVIEIENLWKEYRLGVIGHGTLTHDLQSWWARVRGKDDPNSKIPMLKGQEKQIEGDRFWALRDINLEVKEGEILGIIGKNGAGKSTLLKILSRVTAPTRGNIKVKGRIACLLEVGTGFHPELTGRENIFMNGAILGLSKLEIRTRLDEIIDFSGIESFIDTPVKRYSSGMYVRLAFAVAAHLEPEILVVDEVLAVGDSEFQKKCLGKMDDIRKEGRTILFVSHNMASVENLCTQVMIIKNGEITNQGLVREMIDLYLSEVHLKNSKENSVYERMNIPPTSKVWIRKIEMMVDEKKTSVIRSGKNLEFRIYYDTRGIFTNCNLNIGIYNQYNEKIIHAGTIYNNINFKANGKGKVKFTLCKIPLPSAYYHANFSLDIGGELSDRIKKAIFFHVEQGDFYGSGKVPSTNETKMLANYSWDIG